MMNLNEKGRFAPPPQLNVSAAQSLCETLAKWHDVHARTHWLLGDETVVDGADFYVGQQELGHLHLDGEAHVAVGPKLQKALVKARLAKTFRWSDEFVTWKVLTDEARAHTEWLFSLRYAVINGAPLDSILVQIESARDRR